MTDQTTEIDAEGMRCLLVAMGARPINVSQLHFIGFSAKLDWWVTEGHRLPAFALACLRFLESDEARKVCYVEQWSCDVIVGSIRVGRNDAVGIDKHFTGPLESRIVRAACAVAAEVKRAKEASK